MIGSLLDGDGAVFKGSVQVALRLILIGGACVCCVILSMLQRFYCGCHDEAARVDRAFHECYGCIAGRRSDSSCMDRFVIEREVILH